MGLCGNCPGSAGLRVAGDTREQALANIREAIELCLEAQGDKLEPLDFVGVQKVTVG